MSDPYGDFRQRREASVWQSLNRLMVALIVFACCILILCAFIPLLKQQRELSTRADDLRAEIDKKKIVLAKAQREEDLLRNDREYIELMARDRLDLMKDDEVIFRLDPPPMPDKSNFKLKK